MVKQKDTESESEGMMHAEEPRFRISVCMKRYYSDERARACICVSARRRVRWLHRRLRRLFALPRAFRLLSRGHLLPRDEPLALLDRDDLVEVIPMHADNDETATAQDAVDSVAVVDTEDVVACENEYNPAPSLALSPPLSPALSPPLSLAPSSASPSALLLPSWPDQPDDLMASKRRALMMVEQLYAGDARPRRRRVRRRRRAHAREPLDQSPSADDEHSKRASDDEHSQERAPTALRAPEAAAVVRNAHAPRAPRVVHPLCDAHAPSAPRVVHPLCDAHAPSAPRVVHPLCDAHAPSAPRVVHPLCDAHAPSAPRVVHPLCDAHAPSAPRVVHPLCDAHAPSAPRVVHPLCDAHAPSAPRVVHPLGDAHAPSAPASTTLPSVAHAIFT